MILRHAKKLAVGGAIIAIAFVILIAYDLYEQMHMQTVRVPLVSSEITEITLEEYIAQKDDLQVIDIREIEEFSQGHFTDARHIPLGELLASESKKEELRALGEKKTTAFFCHDGLRSQIAADHIGTENVVIFHKGHRQVRKNESAKDVWTGSRKRVLPEDFHDALKAREYDLTEIPTGAVIADVTWDQVYRAQDQQVIAAPLMRLKQEEITAIVEGIAPQSFIAVCNSRMSCFYAKVLGYRVEQRGGYFSGYYRMDGHSE